MTSAVFDIDLALSNYARMRDLLLCTFPQPTCTIVHKLGIVIFLVPCGNGYCLHELQGYVLVVTCNDSYPRWGVRSRKIIE